MMAEIGDNNPPFDFFALFDLIVSSSANTTEKLVALIRARHVGKSGVAFPSRDRQMSMASCSQRTYTRAKPVADAFFHVDERRGRPAKYRPNTLISEGDIENAIADIRKTEKAKMATSEKAKMAHSEERKGQNGAEEEAKMASEKGPKWPPSKEKDLVNDLGKSKTPVVPKPRSRRDPFGLNPTLTEMHRDCWFDENDRLQVANGFEVELLKITGDGERLRIELDSAMRFVGPNTPGTVLRSKVLGQVQSQIADKRDRDARYERAAAVKSGNRDGPPPNEHWSDAERRRARQADEAVERLKAKYKTGVTQDG
jgi:hypothetical protein